jgi:hypothetical protein
MWQLRGSLCPQNYQRRVPTYYASDPPDLNSSSPVHSTLCRHACDHAAGPCLCRVSLWLVVHQPCRTMCYTGMAHCMQRRALHSTLRHARWHTCGHTLIFNRPVPSTAGLACAGHQKSIAAVHNCDVVDSTVLPAADTAASTVL